MSCHILQTEEGAQDANQGAYQHSKKESKSSCQGISIPETFRHNDLIVETVPPFENKGHHCRCGHPDELPRTSFWSKYHWCPGEESGSVAMLSVMYHSIRWSATVTLRWHEHACMRCLGLGVGALRQAKV